MDCVAGLAHMGVSGVGILEKSPMPTLCLSLSFSVLCQALVDHHGWQLLVCSAGLASCTPPRLPQLLPG